MGLFVKDFNEFVADDLALALRVRHSCQLVQEALRGIHGDQVQLELLFQVLLHLAEFVLAQHAVVHKYTGQPVAQSAVYQGGGHGRIHTAGKRADGASLLSYGFAHLPDGFIDEVLRSPVAAGAADVVNEITQQVGAEFGVVHLRMKLHGEYAP